MAIYNRDRDRLLNTNNTLYEVVMMADKDGNIINAASAASNLNISMGMLEGYSGINNNGTSNAIAGGATSSIWGVSDTVYPWNTVATGGTLTVRTTLNNGSLSTLDDGHHVHVYGLDADYNRIDEVIDIVGSGGTGTKTFYRINKMVFHDGPLEINSTNIDVLMGGVIVGRILIGAGTNSTLLYTVPAGYTAYITQGTASCNYGGDATVRMFVRVPLDGDTGGFISTHVFEINGAGGQYFYPFTVPATIPEKSDIDIRAIARQNNTIITCAYDIILVENSVI